MIMFEQKSKIRVHYEDLIYMIYTLAKIGYLKSKKQPSGQKLGWFLSFTITVYKRLIIKEIEYLKFVL